MRQERNKIFECRQVIVFSAFTLLGYKSATASACNCDTSTVTICMQARLMDPLGTSVSEQVGPCPKPDIYLLQETSDT